jgi:DNA-binding NtrC family response regulator
LNILVLEDEVLIAMDVEQLCLDNGAGRVVLARSVADASAVDVSDGIDAAIIDVMLDGESTLDFARDLHAQGIPFIFASGYTDVDGLREAFPAVAVVGKPYAGNDLIESLAAAAAGRR